MYLLKKKFGNFFVKAVLVTFSANMLTFDATQYWELRNRPKNVTSCENLGLFMVVMSIKRINDGFILPPDGYFEVDCEAAG